jgi:hypothetical protein
MIEGSLIPCVVDDLRQGGFGVAELDFEDDITK